MAERHSSASQQVSGVGVQTVEDVRLTQSGLWTPSGAITSRSGMVPSGAAAAPGSVLASSPTPNGFVHVQPFRKVLQSNRGGGVYEQCLDAIKDINILSTSADPSNARRDLIIAQQNDNYFLDADSDYVVKQVVGTPSGSPVDPPVPGSSDYEVLARVTVPAGATSITQGNITNLYTQLTVATGGLLPVADATERNAVASPYDGMQVYRRDLDWIETYDGTAWRAPAWCRTTALANITSPFSGQMALLTTDNFMYRWTGSAWTQTLDTAADIGGEWRDARTTPTIATGSNKLQFATSVVAANGITFNGTDTWTVQTTGIYNVFCQLRETTAQNAGIAMGGTTYADSTLILPFLAFSGGPDIGLAGTVKLTAGQVFCLWIYVNGSTTTISNGTRNAMFKIWRK